MRRVRQFMLVTGLAALGATASGFADAPEVKNFVTHPTGSEEVPARETDATGQAVFHLSEDGTALSYRLIVANIENVVASHIHLGVFGVNGPVVAFLAGPNEDRIDHLRM